MLVVAEFSDGKAISSLCQYVLTINVYSIVEPLNYLPKYFEFLLLSQLLNQFRIK